MGYQESVVRLDQKQVKDFLTFTVNNREWFVDRGFAPYGAVRILKTFCLDGLRFNKGEIHFYVGGDRYPQRDPEYGIWELPQVRGVIFIDWFEKLRKNNETVGELVDEYTEYISDLTFYKPYLKNE